MAKLGRHAGLGHGLHEAAGGHGLALEGEDVALEVVGEGVVGHVEQAEADLADTGVSGQEVLAAYDAVDELLGHGFAGLVVPGEGVEEVGLYGEVLHELAGQFHEVPVDIGAGEALEADAREEGVEGVAELV